MSAPHSPDAAGTRPARASFRLPPSPDAAPEIAVERLDGAGPHAVGVLFCGGFHSSMRGDKARAIETWCEARGHACTRFDYRGHGDSGGDVERLTLADWLDDALAVVDRAPGDEPLVVVGSSMGAWLAVHVALRRPGRVAALALVAAAPDFLQEGVEPRLEASELARLGRGLVVRLPTPESAAGYPITRALLDSGRTLALLSGDATVATIDCPVRMLHGSADDVAPWTRAAALLERFEGADATLELVRAGDHRLSTPADLARLLGTLDALVASVALRHAAG